MHTAFTMLVKPVFLVLVTIATTLGLMFVDNPREEAQAVQRNVVEAYENVREYSEQNPKQIVDGTVVVMFASSVIWISLLRTLRSRAVNLIVPEPLQKVQPQQENPIVEKAKNRAIYNQLCQDKIVLIGRSKWLPEELTKIRKEVAEANESEDKASRALALAEERRYNAEKQLAKLLEEDKAQTREIICIEAEINRLKELI